MILHDTTLVFKDAVDFSTVAELNLRLKKYRKATVSAADLAAITALDSAGVAFLKKCRDYYHLELLNIPEHFAETVNTFMPELTQEQNSGREENFFVRTGEMMVEVWNNLGSALVLTSEIVLWSFVGWFSNKNQRKGSLIQQTLLIGADAVGIIALLSVIIGLILALQSAAQLRQFGANIFVADLIAISMVREMGPMMTAIIVAGRSGSAIASEIATMVVTEEVDALKMMAINPVRYVVVPKFNAMTISMPLLVTLSILVGIGGGLLVGITYLNLSVNAYITESISILTAKDIFIGLSKSVFFAWVIVIIGAYYGFRVTGGAEGVGRATTASVVASVFAVIVLDAIFSLIFLV